MLPVKPKYYTFRITRLLKICSVALIFFRFGIGAISTVWLWRHVNKNQDRRFEHCSHETIKLSIFYSWIFWALRLRNIENHKIPAVSIESFHIFPTYPLAWFNIFLVFSCKKHIGRTDVLFVDYIRLYLRNILLRSFSKCSCNSHVRFSSSLNRWAICWNSRSRW